jgi:hypothetical protein
MLFFNGELYSGYDLELKQSGGSHYLGIQEGNIPLNELLLITDDFTKNPENLFNTYSSNIQKDIIRKYYSVITDSHKSAKDLPLSLNSEVLKILEGYKGNGQLSSYTYSLADDFIAIEAYDDFPQKIQPFIEAQEVRAAVIKSNNPLKVSNDFLSNIYTQISSGKLLIIDGLTTPQTKLILSKDLLLKHYRLLLLDKSEKDKESQFAKDLSIENNASQSLLAEASLGDSFEGLLNESGDITPPDKNIYVLKSPESDIASTANAYAGLDYLLFTDAINRRPSDLVKEFDLDSQGFLYPFLINDYQIVSRHLKYNEPGLDILNDLLTSPDKTNLVLNAHGGDNCRIKFYQDWEIHVIGPEFIEEDNNVRLQNIKRIKARIANLKSKYSHSSFEVWGGSTLTSPISDVSAVLGKLPAEYKYLAKNRQRIVEIGVTNSFYHPMSKKSVFYNISCHGGKMVDDQTSRVFISSESDLEINFATFFRDMDHINKYLLKEFEPGPVTVTEDNFRNYNIINSFNFLSINDAYRCASFNSQPDTLCNLTYSAPSGETVSVAPHVKDANYDKVVFNSPISENYHEDVFTIDYSACKIPKEEGVTEDDYLKQDWTNAKEVTFKWKEKISRKWKPEDFDSEGVPKIPLIKIKINHDKAVSKFSEVKLTGNPKACDQHTCYNQESYEKPANLKYNGTGPKTDFYMYLPCHEQPAVYEACDKSEIIKFPYPEKEPPFVIKANSKCFSSITPTKSQEQNARIMDSSVLSNQNSEGVVQCKHSCSDINNCFKKVFHCKQNLDDKGNKIDKLYLGSSQVSSSVWDITPGPEYSAHSKDYCSDYSYAYDAGNALVVSRSKGTFFNNIKLPVNAEATHGLVANNYSVNYKKLNGQTLERYALDSRQNVYREADCQNTTSSTICISPEGNFIDGQNVGSDSIGYTRSTMFKDQVAAYSQDGVSIVSSSGQTTISEGKDLQIYGGHVVYHKECTHPIIYKKNNYGSVDLDCLYYDGVMVGISKDFAIFEDDLLFATKLDMSKPPEELELYFINDIYSLFFFFNGRYLSYDKIENIDKNEVFYHVKDLMTHDGHTLIVLTGEKSQKDYLVHDFRVVDEGDEILIGPFSMSGSNYIYAKDGQIRSNLGSPPSSENIFRSGTYGDYFGDEFLNFGIIGNNIYVGNESDSIDELDKDYINGTAYYESSGYQQLKSCHIRYREDFSPGRGRGLKFGYIKFGPVS